jgi:ABC-type transport system involved in multi-copper enzyme maturation permease subunit
MQADFWRPVVIIARLTWLEALRGRLAWLVLAALAAALVLVEFAGTIAVTESVPIKAAFLGSLLRGLAVFILSLFVASSMMREFTDKTIELMLSLPLPRTGYYLGRLAGYLLVAAAIAAVFTLAACIVAPWRSAVIWGISLWCELLIVAGATLLCTFTLSQITAAISAAAAFYLLARSMAAMQLMSTGPLVDPHSLANTVMAHLIDALAYVLPALHHFTASEWLAYPDVSATVLIPILIQTVIYSVLLFMAGLFDLHRRNF